MCKANIGRFHGRPPDPDDADRSSTGETHIPMTAGIEMNTFGIIGLDGGATVTVVWFANDHFSQLD